MKNNKTNEPKAPKQKGGFTRFVKILTILITSVVVLTSASYCAFVTVILANGSQNFYLALPTIIAIGGSIFTAVAITVSTFVKR